MSSSHTILCSLQIKTKINHRKSRYNCLFLIFVYSYDHHTAFVDIELKSRQSTKTIGIIYYYILSTNYL